MVTCRGFMALVYEIVQATDDNVHEVGLKVPPPPPSLSVTVPFVIAVELEVSVTDMLSVSVPPAFTVLEFDVTDTEVESGLVAYTVVISLGKLAENNEANTIVTSKKDFIIHPASTFGR
jgi:hypothetical protein